jgi:hypothetical protein
MIDKMIAAVQILDESFMETKQKKNEPSYVTHTKAQHWGGGKLAQ